MGVGITYTGVDGKITSFDSSSVNDAYSRLSSIKGFNKTPFDDVAAESVASVLSSWRKRSSRRATRSTELQNAPLLNHGLKRTDFVTNVEMKDGHMFVTKQGAYKTEDGTLIPVGGTTRRCVNDGDDLNGTGCGRDNL